VIKALVIGLAVGASVGCGGGSSGGTSQPEAAADATPVVTYPNGLTKAVVFSFDDGMEDDLPLIALLNNHGLRGTFNLNSGLLGSFADWRPNQSRYFAASEIATVYAGHEVASHSNYHTYLTALSDDELRTSITSDQTRLGALTQYPITSHAFPFGVSDERVRALLQEVGITNARGIMATGDFNLPSDRLNWSPTCHYSQMATYLQRYLTLAATEPTVFYIWGHSWELTDNSGDLERLDGQLASLAQAQDIWSTTSGELAGYLIASEQLQRDESNLVTNPAGNDTVWVRYQGQVHQLFAGDSLQLD